MSGLDPYKSEKEAQLAQDKKLELKRQNYLMALKKVLRTPEGKLVVFNILMKTKFFESSYTGNSGTFFNEGKRDVGREVLIDVKDAAPEMTAQFFEELLKKDIE
jgi:hypothetical protein